MCVKVPSHYIFSKTSVLLSRILGRSTPIFYFARVRVSWRPPTPAAAWPRAAAALVVLQAAADAGVVGAGGALHCSVTPPLL